MKPSPHKRQEPPRPSAPMPGRWLVLAALVALVALPASQAQGPEAEPVVEIEAADIADLIVPLGEPATTTVEVRVGCEAAEIPQTTTTARLSVPDPAGYEDAVISPASLSWVTGPGDCPSLGTPFVANATLSLALTQNAPGFQEQTLPVEVVVEKRLTGEPAPNRTYGPATTAVSYTPGYFNLYNLRLDQKVQQVDAGDGAVFQPIIDNFSNHETRFEAALVEAPDGVAVAIEPEVVVLAPDATGTFEVAVSLDGPISRVVNEVANVQVSVGSNTTHPAGGEGATSQLSMLVQFRRIPGDEIPAVGPGLTAGIAVLAVVAVAARHRPR